MLHQFCRGITVYKNVQTDDTPENRFVKFALQIFSGFLNRMRLKLEEIGNGNVWVRLLRWQVDAGKHRDLIADCMNIETISV
jgi:hypothetical protein